MTSRISVVVAAQPGTQEVCERALGATPGIRVVACARTRECAGAVAQHLQPDVIVAELPVVCLSDFLLSGWGPVSRATRIIVVGHEESEELQARLCAMGATAYVPLGRVATQLAETVCAACAPGGAVPVGDP
jgi:DNA-binding NarL/FixJ family response regulator